MSFWTRELRATYAFVERNFNLVKRYWGWELVWITYSIVNSLAITFIGAGMEKISGQSVDTQFLILYLLVGTLIWSYLSVVFDSISEMITWERWEGTIEYTFMAPVSRSTHMIGTTLFAVAYGIFRTLITLGVVTFFFQINLEKANLAGAMLLLLIGSVSFIGFGIVAAVLPLLFPERGSQMTHVIEALLLLISGIYYPISVLPDWLQTVSMLSPATYVLDAMREAILHGKSTVELLPYAWPLLVMGVITIPFGLLVFGIVERFAKRTGRLKRSG